jgi:two-component system response regulator PilR (NtrC family)
MKLMAALLIVDDDATLSDTLYEAFEDEYLCHVARTTEEALSYLETEKYDVVVTDISMPGMSGLELLGHIRRTQTATPVIVISGISSHKEYSDDIKRLGAFDYLGKPFPLKELEESVARAVEHHARVRRAGQR